MSLPRIRSLARRVLSAHLYERVSTDVVGPIRRLRDRWPRPPLSNAALAALVTRMARTGEGTDECLKQGSLPLPVHFYSPVPNLDDLERRRVWTRRSELAGIAFSPESQVAYLRTLGRQYGGECAWPAVSAGGSQVFFTENGAFGFGCAAAAHCIVRERKPRRVLEIGSGNSSLVLSAALERNTQEGAPAAEYTVVDPYPSALLQGGQRPPTEVVAKRVETLEPQFFAGLERNDILFIDSGHTVRIGGDVNFLILDVLPRLRPGVLVHFHDIGLPYEYPKAYATTPSFRMLWTEAYLLQAFLACNDSYDVLLALAYLMVDRAPDFRAAFPMYDPAQHVSVSGSFWIARR